MKLFNINLKKSLEQNKELIFYCILYTFIIGMLSHGYMYFQNSFSHDSLNEFNAEIYGNYWKLQLGRFMVPVYKYITTGNILLPYLTGIYSLLWISLAAFFTVKIFNIKSRTVMAFICGVFTVNLTVIGLTATYMHDLDADMFAMLLSVCAVYFWNKKNRYCFLLSVICTVICLAIYQAYISTTITLIIIFCIIQLLKNENFNNIMRKLYKAAAILVISGITYYLINVFLHTVLNIEEIQSYNSLNRINLINLKVLISRAIRAYRVVFYEILFPKSALSKSVIFLISILLLCRTGYIFICNTFERSIDLRNRLMVLLLIFVLPAGMNLSQILSGVSHDLMHYALWMFYLFIILTADSSGQCKADKHNRIFISTKHVSFVLIFAILFGNAKLANELYLKKSLEQDAIIALYTRVWDKMEKISGYNRETTRVVFIGKPEQYAEAMTGFEKSHRIVGGNENYSVGSVRTLTQNCYRSLFQYKLHYDIVVGDSDDVKRLNNSVVVKEMPAFPDEESLKLIDGILVIKMGK